MNDTNTSGGSFWAIQVVEPVKSEHEAIQILDALRAQEGCLGGRINPPAKRGWWEIGGVPVDPVWNVQAIFETNGGAPRGWLPDGMRHVLILESQRVVFGIVSP